MFAKTGNPYFVVSAIAAARIAKWRAPDWALTALLDAVKDAYFLTDSPDISIDAALGLRAKRGEARKKAKALRESSEQAAFDDIWLLRECFQISVEAACELIYFEKDFEFHSRAAFFNAPPIPYSPDMAEIGLTESDIQAMNQKAAAEKAAFFSSADHNVPVRNRIDAGDWHAVTIGDRLGYGIERLIERYHKVGVRASGGSFLATDKKAQPAVVFAHGRLLLFSGTVCYSQRGLVPDDAKRLNPLKSIPKKDGFANFLSRLEALRLAGNTLFPASDR